MFFDVNAKQWEVNLKVKKLFKAKTTMFKKSIGLAQNVPPQPYF